MENQVTWEKKPHKSETLKLSITSYGFMYKPLNTTRNAVLKDTYNQNPSDILQVFSSR